jgi:hypothetical protein
MAIFGAAGHLRDAEVPDGGYRVEEDYPPSAWDPDVDEDGAGGQATWTQ